MRARHAMLVVLSLLAVVAAACGGTSSQDEGEVDRNQGDKGSLPIVSAGFTESDVLANMYAEVLGNAGYKTGVQKVSATEVAQGDLEKGRKAIMPQYVATYADLLQRQVNGVDAPSVASPDLNESYDALKKLAEPLGLTPLEPSKAVDQNAFAVHKDFAAEHNLKTLSDLGELDMPITLAAGTECKDRPYCLPGLEKVYGIEIDKIDPLGVDTVQSKEAVQQGADEMALVLTTDATVEDFDLVVLEDDKNLQNADNVVPIVNTEKLTPEIEEILNELSSTLTTEDLAQLNKQVDVEQMKPVEVADEYLKDKGLI